MEMQNDLANTISSIREKKHSQDLNKSRIQCCCHKNQQSSPHKSSTNKINRIAFALNVKQTNN